MALVGFWKLNDNAANLVVVATTGSNGIYTENSSITFSATGPGTQVTASQALDGSGAQLAGVATGSYASGQAFSVSIFFKSNQAINRLMYDGTDDVGRIILLGTGVRVGAATTFTTSTQNDTNWHHLLVTRDTSNNAKVFLDGVASVDNPQTITDTTAIGTIGQDTTAAFNGNIAWAKFFSDDESANAAALSAERNLPTATYIWPPAPLLMGLGF